jgi:hypothetical protein
MVYSGNRNESYKDYDNDGNSDYAEISYDRDGDGHYETTIKGYDYNDDGSFDVAYGSVDSDGDGTAEYQVVSYQDDSGNVNTIASGGDPYGNNYDVSETAEYEDYSV